MDRSRSTDILAQMEYVSLVVSPLLVAARENGHKLHVETIPASAIEAAREIVAFQKEGKSHIVVTAVA